jgi:hypothetical protein
VLLGAFIVLGCTLFVVVLFLAVWLVNPSPGQVTPGGRRYGRW